VAVIDDRGCYALFRKLRPSAFESRITKPECRINDEIPIAKLLNVGRFYCICTFCCFSIFIIRACFVILVS